MGSPGGRGHVPGITLGLGQAPASPPSLRLQPLPGTGIALEVPNSWRAEEGGGSLKTAPKSCWFLAAPQESLGNRHSEVTVALLHGPLPGAAVVPEVPEHGHLWVAVGEPVGRAQGRRQPAPLCHQHTRCCWSSP